MLKTEFPWYPGLLTEITLFGDVVLEKSPLIKKNDAENVLKTDKIEQVMEKEQENFMKQLEHRKIMLKKQQEGFLKLME